MIWGSTEALLLSQKRGIPHAHICLCLSKRDKLRVGINSERTNDRIDQMIWGEIPVWHADKTRPKGWRMADKHRSNRWTDEKIMDQESDAEEEAIMEEHFLRQMESEDGEGMDEFNGFKVNFFNYSMLRNGIRK